MAGGLFGLRFHLNLKCILFTLMIVGIYWFAPPRNIYFLIFCLWFPYILMAWYDSIYQCQLGLLEPTIIPFGQYLFLPFKPPSYQQRFRELAPEQIQAMNTLDHLILWSVLVGFIGFGLYRYYK